MRLSHQRSRGAATNQGQVTTGRPRGGIKGRGESSKRKPGRRGETTRDGESDEEQNNKQPEPAFTQTHAQASTAVVSAPAQAWMGNDRECAHTG